jgi:hypothetical protein
MEGGQDIVDDAVGVDRRVVPGLDRFLDGMADDDDSDFAGGLVQDLGEAMVESAVIIARTSELAGLPEG